MRKEDRYIEQLTEMGVWRPAYYDEVHQLCILERELSRTLKEWHATAAAGHAPSVTDPRYEIVSRLRRDILTHRDALGLTPRGYRKLTGKEVSGTPPVPQLSELLASLAGRVAEYDGA